MVGEVIKVRRGGKRKAREETDEEEEEEKEKENVRKKLKKTEEGARVESMGSALKSGPVRFLHVFLQDRDRTGPRSFQNPKKPDRNR